MIETQKIIKKIANAEEKFKRRIPFSEWLDKPEGWDKKKFFDETAEYLFQNYGITHSYNKNALGMLTDQMDIYIQATNLLKDEPLIIALNAGKTLAPHPAISIRNNAANIIIKLMKELGLTPNSHLSASKLATEDSIDDLLKGPKAA
jgi:P27 family predicted phage terminase small subunit